MARQWAPRQAPLQTQRTAPKPLRQQQARKVAARALRRPAAMVAQGAAAPSKARAPMQALTTCPSGCLAVAPPFPMLPVAYVSPGHQAAAAGRPEKGRGSGIRFHPSQCLAPAFQCSSAYVAVFRDLQELQNTLSPGGITVDEVLRQRQPRLGTRRRIQYALLQALAHLLPGGPARWCGGLAAGLRPGRRGNGAKGTEENGLAA